MGVITLENSFYLYGKHFPELLSVLIPSKLFFTLGRKEFKVGIGGSQNGLIVNVLGIGGGIPGVIGNKGEALLHWNPLRTSPKYSGPPLRLNLGP